MRCEHEKLTLLQEDILPSSRQSNIEVEAIYAFPIYIFLLKKSWINNAARSLLAEPDVIMIQISNKKRRLHDQMCTKQIII